MKIIIVTTYYSFGMGYTENCLPRALANLGHDVHVIASNLNVYGNQDDYAQNYQSFLGDADQGIGTFPYNGYTVHRLPSRSVAGYVQIIGLAAKVKELKPDIVHSVAIASVQTYLLSAIKLFMGFKLFTESHHHLSVVKPFLKDNGFYPVKRSLYWLTRTFPTFLASLAVEKCYAVAPDCLLVAHKYFGVPMKKLQLQSLGSDTSLFYPAQSAEELEQRRSLREKLGYSENDLVCVYTGRFTKDKNPLLLAQAINTLSQNDPRWKGLFVGDGQQASEILKCKNTQAVPFMTHADLAKHYSASDIAIWPRQESMSMLDAASSALPLIVSDEIGESDRVKGSGLTYKDNDADSLISALLELKSQEIRVKYGQAGRKKMTEHYNWNLIAAAVLKDYEESLSK